MAQAPAQAGVNESLPILSAGIHSPGVIVTMRDPYDILGLTPRASAADIHAAYRRLAKRHHPDLNPGDPTAEARFKEIAHAYAILSDPLQRAALDRDMAPAAGWDEWGAEATAPHHYSSPDIGYGTRRSDGLFDDVGAVRQSRPRRMGWAVVLGLWFVLTFANSMLRGAEIELDGVIVAVERIPVPIAHFLLVLGPWRPLYSRAERYTIRRPDGGSDTFIAGQACSLLSEPPRTGALIHKEAWRLSYDLDGHRVSELSTASLPCAMHVTVNLTLACAFLVLGLRRRTNA